jgi:hypothetical protein
VELSVRWQAIPPESGGCASAADPNAVASAAVALSLLPLGDAARGGPLTQGGAR